MKNIHDQPDIQTLEQGIESAIGKAQIWGFAELWFDGESYFACAPGWGYGPHMKYVACVNKDGSVETV